VYEIGMVVHMHGSMHYILEETKMKIPSLLNHWVSILAVGQIKHINGSIEHFNN